MPTLAMLAVLLAAPAASDRSAPFVEVAPIEAPEASAAAEASPPEPAPAPPPSADPWPPPPPVASAPPPDDRPPPPTSRRRAAAPRPDRPIRWRVDLLGALGTTRIRDTAWRAFGDDRSAFQVSATIRADAPIGGGRVFLGGGATYRRFGAYGQLYDVLYNDIRVREPLAFARLAVVAVQGVDVVAQVGAGPSIVDVFVSGDRWADQRSVVAMVDGLAGLNLYLPKRWLPRRGAARVTGGLELAAGYTWRGTVNVQPTPSTAEDPIQTQGAPLGGVAIQGFAWRFGVFVRFF